ncbi:MAG: Hpt domain-containing protein [Zoogloea sp.]|nr:Hpt domain-containing protein [Zoogloea sp.]
MLLGLPGVNGKRESPMLQRLVALFVTETVRNVRSLQRLIATGDSAAVKALVHKMKSGCFAIGALRLAALARALDERMKSGAEPTPTEATGFAEAWEGCRQALLDEGLISMELWSRVEGPLEQ